MRKKNTDIKCLYCGKDIEQIIKTEKLYDHYKNDEKIMDLKFEREKKEKIN